MPSREACLNSACSVQCCLLQEPVRGSSEAKRSAGSPSPASCKTPTRRYSRAWDELTPVSQMLWKSPDRVPAHLLSAAAWVPSQVLDSGTPSGSSAQLAVGKLPTVPWVRWVPAGPMAVSDHSKHGTWGSGAATKLLYVMKLLFRERC